MVFTHLLRELYEDEFSVSSLIDLLNPKVPEHINKHSEISRANLNKEIKLITVYREKFLLVRVYTT